MPKNQNKKLSSRSGPVPTKISYVILNLLVSFLVLNTNIARAQTILLTTSNPTITANDVVGDFIGPPTNVASGPAVVISNLTSTQQTLLDVCQEKGYGVSCAKTLVGIMWKESQGVATAIGDNGKARGYFQIHYKLHGITIKCAEDLKCSARWTLSYLEQNSYPKYVTYAVQCHNGCNAGNGYAASAIRWGNLIWSQPISYEVALK